MMTTSEIARVYDTILSIPSMGENVKIDFRISRKNVLVLSYILNRGLSMKTDEKDGGLLSNVGEETFEELRILSEECLDKAGLKELSEKLTALNSSKG